MDAFKEAKAAADKAAAEWEEQKEAAIAAAKEAFEKGQGALQGAAGMLGEYLGS